MKKYHIKQFSGFKRNNQKSSFIFTPTTKPNIVINQSQILSSGSEQKILIISAEKLQSVLLEKKEFEIVELMREAERKIQCFKYDEAEIIYNLLKNVIFPKHLECYKTYFAKILTGLGYISFYQNRFNDALDYFHRASKYWEQVNNHAQVVYCLQMLGVVYRYRSKKGDYSRGLNALEEGEFIGSVSSRVTKKLRNAMLGNCLRDKAEILLQSGYPEEAYKISARSLSYLKNSGKVIYSYTKFVNSRALWELSNYDKSLTQIDKVIKLIDRQPIFKLRCHTFLMYIFMNVVSDQSESYKHFTKAIEAVRECENVIEVRNLFKIAKNLGFVDRIPFRLKKSAGKMDFDKSYDYFQLL